MALPPLVIRPPLVSRHGDARAARLSHGCLRGIVTQIWRSITAAALDAMFRPLAIQARLDKAIMYRVGLRLYDLGTSVIEREDARERIQTMLGPDPTDASTAALTTVLDMMSSLRGMAERADDLYSAIVAGVPRFCRGPIIEVPPGNDEDISILGNESAGSAGSRINESKGSDSSFTSRSSLDDRVVQDDEALLEGEGSV